MRLLCTLVQLAATNLAIQVSNEDLTGLVMVLKGLELHQGIRMSGNDSGILRKMARQASYDDVLFTKLKFVDRGQVWPIVHLSDSLSDIDSFVEILWHEEYRSEELILVTTYDFDSVKDTFKTVNLSRAFLTYQLGQDHGKILRIQTFRSSLLLLETPWYFSTSSQKFKKVYDFQGAPMTFIATTYDFPYLIVEPCIKKPHLACNAFGSDMDTMKYLMSKYNFTLEIHIEPNNNFGMTPIQGNVGKF